MDERIAVSHVCSGWRALAMRTPRIWSRLDFVSTYHEAGCDCYSCMGAARRLTCPNCLKPYDRGRSNITTIARLLPRSARLALTVHLNIRYYTSGVDPVDALARTLFPHCDRLVEVHILAEDEGAFPGFFNGLPDDLPVLRTISCQRSPENQDYGDPVDLVGRHVSWPSLQFLEFPDYLVYPNGNVLFPFVRTVETIWIETAQLQGYLTACPQLNTLCVRMVDALQEPAQHYDSIRPQTRGIQCLKIRELCSRDEPHVLTMFHHPSCRKLALHYARETVVGATSGGLQILADLRGHVRVSFRRDDGHGGRLALVAADQHGCTREIAFSPFTASFTFTVAVLASGIWAHLSSASVNCLTFDSDLWPRAREALPALPSVRQLTFRGSLAGVLAQAHRAAVLPALETLRLVGLGSSPGAVAAGELAFFVINVRGGGRLRTTILDYVCLEGEPDAVLGNVTAR